MKLIDAHIHCSNIESFKQTALKESFVDYSYRGLEQEMEQAGVLFAIGMGVTENSKGGFPDTSAVNPMGLDMVQYPSTKIVSCVGVNPVLLATSKCDEELSRLEKELEKQSVVGIKIYAGYYPYYVYDEIYHPIYNLAAKHRLPVVIHSGDTYSERALLKYSHPLTVDELAVSFRDVTFIIAHLGDPWVLDAVEVVHKNPNVFADLSGLIVGDGKEVQRFMNKPLFMDHFRRALVYLDRYDKVLFGSDWPLVPIAPYVRFVKKLVPKEFYQDVFHSNALRAFPRLTQLS